MSIVLKMVQANVPLCKWRTFDATVRYSFRSKEDTRKIASIILKQCGHDDVVEIVAREFEQFPERLRIDFRTLAASQGSNSGNVRKGLQKLNNKLNGQLLRTENVTHVNKRVETADGVSYVKVRVDEAKAAAQRKYWSK